MDRKLKNGPPGARQNSGASVGTQAASLFLAAMLQWATVLAVCPQLHELIHHDADEQHHECAVTLFLTGQVEQSVLDPIVISEPAPVPAPLGRSYDPRSYRSFFLSCRLLEHAPPRRS